MTGGEEASRYEEWSQSGWRTHLGGPGSLDIGREVALLGDETIPALAAAAAARVPGRVAVSVDGAALTHAELDEQAARVAEFTGFFLLGNMIEFDKTEIIFKRPAKRETEDYITGRFG